MRTKALRPAPVTTGEPQKPNIYVIRNAFDEVFRWLPIALRSLSTDTDDVERAMDFARIGFWNVDHVAQHGRRPTATRNPPPTMGQVQQGNTKWLAQVREWMRENNT